MSELHTNSRQIAKDLLQEAYNIIANSRASTHGEANETFSNMANLASAYLGIPITPTQTAWLMVLFKLARTMNGDKTHKDHYIDAAAYAALAGGLSIPQESKNRMDLTLEDMKHE